MNSPNRQLELLDKFWNYLSFLGEYVDISEAWGVAASDPARTKLLSRLSQHMHPVLRADVSFIGYRDIKGSSDGWLQLVEDSIEFTPDSYWESSLVERLTSSKWRIPISELEKLPNGKTAVFFDEGLSNAPWVFHEMVTALAVNKLTLMSREYFLFFCDIDERVTTFPRYTDFDKKMLDIATGILFVGFQSGLRTRMQTPTQQEVPMRLLIFGAFTPVIILAVVIGLLILAAGQVPAIALLLIFVVALLFTLMSFIFTLVVVRAINPDQATRLFEDVVGKIPGLQIFLRDRNGTESKDDPS